MTDILQLRSQILMKKNSQVRRCKDRGKCLHKLKFASRRMLSSRNSIVVFPSNSRSANINFCNRSLKNKFTLADK